MKLKLNSASESRLKKLFLSISKFILKKKIRVILIITIFIGFFLIGYFSGLIFSGFFGTLDEPSQKGREFLRSLGFESGLKSVLIGVLKENIKIPFNYIFGQFSNPEKIYIDIKFKDYQKLVYKREQVFNDKFIFYSGDDFVPASIRYMNKEYKAKVRLKGDAPENLEGEKWSMKIDLNGDNTLFGMKTFSIHHPRIRQYLNEYIFHKALKKEGVIGLRYDFIEVEINGKNKGIYGIEEHFDKYLIEDNERREGVIIKFYEDDWYKDLVQKEGKNFIVREMRDDELVTEFNVGNKNITFDKDYLISYSYFLDTGFHDSSVDLFKTGAVLEDNIQYTQFNKARNLFEAFRLGKLKTHEVFDVEKLAKYFAIVSLIGAEHAADWINIRLYYNPITSKLEPIGFNGNSGTDNYKIIHKYFPRCIKFNERECEEKINNYYNLLFSDPVFFEKYISELERVSKKEYLDGLFNELDNEIKEKIEIIHKDMPYYHFSKNIFYENQQYIRDILNPDRRTILAYFDKEDNGELILDVGNLDYLPIDILELEYKGIKFYLNEKLILQPRASSGVVDYKKVGFSIPKGFEFNNTIISELQVNYKVFGANSLRNVTVLPWSYRDDNFIETDFIRQKPVLDNEFLIVDNKDKKITIKAGNWKLDKSLIIPEGFLVYASSGTNLDLINNSAILSYSPLRFYGSLESPIRLLSSDGQGQGIVVIGANERSELNNVIFDDLSFPSKNGWELTGAVTFYESDVKMNNVQFLNARAEDSLNIVKSEFEIKNSLFDGALSDCFDVDFGKGSVENTIFTNCRNDALDFSGSRAIINYVEASEIGDKGISAGEESDIGVNGFKIKNCYIGATSKDLSKLNVNDIKIKNCEYGLTAYQKKPEFGPASIEAVNAEINAKNDYLIEKGSDALINKKIILNSGNNVFDKLYPG